MDPAAWTALGSVAVAVVAGVFGVWNIRETRRGTSAVHDEVKTNHGLRAGEYLERVADLGVSMEVLTAEVRALGQRMATREQLDSHTEEDHAFQRMILDRLKEVN